MPRTRKHDAIRFFDSVEAIRKQMKQSRMVLSARMDLDGRNVIITVTAPVEDALELIGRARRHFGEYIDCRIGMDTGSVQLTF